MLNNIQISFSIKDLENLSGIKAHTIRIWEQRYNILKPKRSDTNIRSYSVEDLQKLLNISLLMAQGQKISKLALLSHNDIFVKVRELASIQTLNHYAINEFKLAMLKFDQDLFNATFNKLISENSFSNVFQQIILPFLDELGILWQSKYITPSHEHFISALIRQKLYFYIEKVQWIEKQDYKKQFVLYLPVNEIHELGLLFIHYHLLLNGYNSLYLGESVPAESLYDLTKVFNNISFVSYFTVKPSVSEIELYLTNFKEKLLIGNNDLHLFGKKIRDAVKLKSIPDIYTYNTLSEFFVNLK